MQALIGASEFISPRAVAEALGVSESSVKRWIDDGRIDALRTAGGHRRVRRSEVVRFARESGRSIADLVPLGLGGSFARAGQLRRGREAEELYERICAGAEEDALSLVVRLYLSGSGVAEIVDGPLQEAMRRIGELWQASPSGIFTEHRAVGIAAACLVRLRRLMPEPGTAISAVGGAPSGDPYTLPSMAVATVLISRGVRAVDLGANTPLSALEHAAVALSPRLVWLSVSSPEGVEPVHAGLASLAERAAEAGAIVAIGGAACDRLELPPLDDVFVGASMRQLDAFVQGLRSASRAAADQG